MSRPVLAVLATVALLALQPAGAAVAAAPANDDLAAAAVLGVAAPVSGVNVDSTVQDAETAPSAGGMAVECLALTDAPFCLPSVWYRFTPDADGTYTIATCDASTEFDTVVAVYSGATLGTLDELAANDDGPGSCAGGYGTNGSSLSFAGTAGTPYSVQVTGYGGGQGSFWLRAYPDADPPPPPAVDTRTEHWTSVAYATAFDDRAGLFSGPRRTPSFGFDSPTDGATFECSLDGAAYSECTSPRSLDGVGGAHVVRVRAVAAGVPDATPLTIPFSIDRTAPDTAITGPEGPLGATTAGWSAVTTEPFYEEQFRCGLDAVPAADICSGDYVAQNLCQGAHTFRSAAIDRAGNLDASPAARTVTVTAGTACGAPVIIPGSTFANVFGSATTQNVQFSFDNHGAGSLFHIEYGTTAAYGEQSQPRSWPPAASDATGTQTLEGLQPSTLYHFRVVFSSPFGTIASDDVTFTSEDTVSELPVLGVGAVTVSGHHAARFPVDLDPHGAAMRLELRIETGPGDPVTLASPIVQVRDGNESGASGARLVELTDLEPGTTYRFRVLAKGSGTEETVLSGEHSFSVPALPVDGPDPTPTPTPSPSPTPTPTPTPEVPRFTLRNSDVVVRPLRRRARTIRLAVSGMPPGSAVRAKARARLKRLGSARGTAGADGVRRLAIALSRKARRFLRETKLKRITIVVAVTPPGQARSSIKRTVKLRR